MEREHKLSFEEYINKMGMKEYPFLDRTAEKENTAILFIEPSDYSKLEATFKKGQSMIINGNRGTGKTIIEDDLKRKVDEGALVAHITNFEQVGMNNNLQDYYSLIMQGLTRELLVFLNSNHKTLRKMNHNQKLFVSFLIKKYGDAITDSALKKDMEKIQLSKFKRLINSVSSPLTKVLNYSATTVTNFGNELLNDRFARYLPDIDGSQVIEIFPEIKFKLEDDFREVFITYAMLDNALETIREITGHKPVVLLDRFDEDSRIENDADILVNFIKDLISDNNLLLNDNVQLVIAVWKIAFEQLSSVFRKSKHFVFEIKWNKKYLLSVFDKRLKTYSRNDDIKWEDMFENPGKIDDILDLANSNPRDLWNLMDNIINAQYENDESKEKITDEAIRIGMDNFVMNFGFYEYYPKRKNSQKNTNDVYSYIKHLGALETDEFTNGELKDKANTGGSTTNYITQMMNIGLVSKTAEKRPGGAVIYKINDPKVRYAIVNNISIER